MTEPTGERSRRTQAATRRSRWPGWIWAVPIAAVGIVTWLMIRAFANRGIDVTVTFPEAAGMRANDTKVTDHGLEVGKVTDVELTKDRKQVLVHLDIQDTVKGDLTTGSHFYLQGAEPSFSDPASLKAVLAGPTILLVPGAGAPSHHFTGSTGEPPEKLGPTSPYRVRFNEDVGKLKPGAAVKLRGFTVGRVDRVDLETNAQSGDIVTSVLLGLDPTRFHLVGVSENGGDQSAVLKTALARLVQNGLRASLTASPPLIGAQQVELEIVPGAAQGQLLTSGPYPEIPAQSGRLADLPAKIGQLPIKEIAENVRVATEHLKAIASSPRITDSLYHVDRMLVELDRTMQAAGPQVAPTLESVRQTTESLRQTADKIDGTAEAARRLLGGSAASPNGNLQQAVHELTGTARSIRTLANFLDQHPEALLRGRESESSGDSR
jgi:paraquat-inducible protein B